MNNLTFSCVYKSKYTVWVVTFDIVYTDGEKYGQHFHPYSLFIQLGSVSACRLNIYPDSAQEHSRGSEQCEWRRFDDWGQEKSFNQLEFFVDVTNCKNSFQPKKQVWVHRKLSNKRSLWKHQRISTSIQLQVSLRDHCEKGDSYAN